MIYTDNYGVFFISVLHTDSLKLQLLSLVQNSGYGKYIIEGVKQSLINISFKHGLTISKVDAML
jgi:hypothetical protein